MSERPPDQGICKCGLAWSYHDGRLKTWDEYEPRYTPPGDDPPARTPPGDAAPDLRAAVKGLRKLADDFEAVGMPSSAAAIRGPLALIDAHECIRQDALAEALDTTPGLSIGMMTAHGLEPEMGNIAAAISARLRPGADRMTEGRARRRAEAAERTARLRGDRA